MGKATAGVGLLLVSLLASSADHALAQDWIPLAPDAAGSPPQPVHPGHLEFRVTPTGPSGRDKIEVRWVPPEGGAPCEHTVLVQTVRISFEHVLEDGTTTTEVLARKSDIYEGVDFETGDEVSDAALHDDRDRDRQANDPNATEDGTYVDSNWCETDAPVNGNDPDADHGQRGTRTDPTSTDDSPFLGDTFFTGTRRKVVMEFEVCACCFRDDGTVGECLGCMRWRYEREKGAARGQITVPQPTSGLPSPSHERAVGLFEQRHPVRIFDTSTVKVCPERGPAEIQAEIDRLNETLRDVEGKRGMEGLADELRRGIQERLDEIRRLRGR